MQAPVLEVAASHIIALSTAIAILAFWRYVVRWLTVLASTPIVATRVSV